VKSERFEAILLEGQKEAAVEVPFDPATRWKAPTVRLGPGRHGHRVQGRLNQAEFTSVVVSRASGFFLLISDSLRESAGVAIGDHVEIILHPEPSPPADHARKRLGRRPRRGPGTSSPTR